MHLLKILIGIVAVQIFFIFDHHGTCYVHGKSQSVIWENLEDLYKKRARGRSLTVRVKSVLDEMLNEAALGDGWLTYDWNFMTKTAYVQKVFKDGMTYIVGSGFFHASAEYRVRQMVDHAIEYAKEKGTSRLFDMVNLPRGPFVSGDIYLWVYDMKGNLYAHGGNLVRIGQNQLDWKDARGNYFVRDIIEMIKDYSEGWSTYYLDGLKKRAYVEKFVDPATNMTYIVGSDYFPNINADKVQNFVREAEQYIMTYGVHNAANEFTLHGSGFMRGSMRIFLYDMEGNVIADGENPEFVGQNLMNTKDPEGRYVTREILRKAKEFGKGHVTFIDRGEYKEVIFKKIETPEGTYVVGSGYWFPDKSRVAESLAARAIEHLRSEEALGVLRDFTSIDRGFLRGDLYVRIYDAQGYILADGPFKKDIWRRDERRDSKGNFIVEKLIATARAGGGWVSYEQNRCIQNDYVKEVVKEMEKAPTEEVGEETDEQKQQRMRRYIVCVSYNS